LLFFDTLLVNSNIHTDDIDTAFKIQDSILSIFKSQGSKFHNNLKLFRTYLN